jgi:hypothetical protein
MISKHFNVLKQTVYVELEHVPSAGKQKSMGLVDRNILSHATGM